MDSIINLQKKIVPELTNLLVQRYQILRQVSHEYRTQGFGCQAGVE